MVEVAREVFDYENVGEKELKEIVERARSGEVSGQLCEWRGIFTDEEFGIEKCLVNCIKFV